MLMDDQPIFEAEYAGPAPWSGHAVAEADSIAMLVRLRGRCVCHAPILHTQFVVVNETLVVE